MKKKQTKKQKNCKKQNLFFEAFNFKDTIFKKDVAIELRNFSWWIFFRNIIFILLGAIITTSTFYYLITPAGLYMNGISSLIQVLTKFILKLQGIERNDPDFAEQQLQLFYPLFFAINIPLIIWGFLKVGFQFSLYTCFYLGFQTIFSQIVRNNPFLSDFQFLGDIRKLVSEQFISVSFLCGALAGMIYGFGIGLLFKTGGSSAGTDFISSFIALKRDYSISVIIRNINISIVMLSVVLDRCLMQNNSPWTAFLGEPYFLATMVYIFISAFVMNRVYPKYMLMTVFIISEKFDKIREFIYSSNYYRGGNVLKVQGFYSGKEYNMIMTTMSLLEYSFFQKEISKIDPKVFMVATDTKYMTGGGAFFKLRNNNAKVTVTEIKE